jgi:dTDP-glucose 4,6-dehydratase
MNYEKTILVTGGMGFIGSNFVNFFVPKYKQYRIINIDSLTPAGDPNNITVRDADNYTFENVDIRDISALEKLFSQYTITDIIHFAAESYVDASIENPQIFVETNIVGTHNLLFLAQKNKIHRFLQVSTDEVYGSLKIGDTPFTKNSSLAPNNPYSASKASADMLVRAYHETYGLDTIITRCTNNYGPNQDYRKLIPKFIRALLQDQKVPLHGKGEHIRDWIYVGDHVEVIDLIFHTGAAGSVYNIGAHNELTNKEITTVLLKLTGQSEDSIEYVSDRAGNDFRYAINTDELFTELGWRATTAFEEGIKKTFEFYKNKNSL